MAGREMPSKHLAVPAAFQANDVITMKRSPDRDGGCPLTFGDGCRFSGRRKIDLAAALDIAIDGELDQAGGMRASDG